MPDPTPEDIARMKQWIDGASYEALLRKWRFAPAGDPYFLGEVADHFASVIRRRREEVGPEAHTAASKSIGCN